MMKYDPKHQVQLSRIAATFIILCFFLTIAVICFAVDYFTILPYVRYHCYNFVTQRDALSHGLNCVSLHP